MPPPLHEACECGTADAADVLLRWGADEIMEDISGKTPGHWIPSIADADEENRPNIYSNA